MLPKSDARIGLLSLNSSSSSSSPSASSSISVSKMSSSGTESSSTKANDEMRLIVNAKHLIIQQKSIDFNVPVIDSHTLLNGYHHNGHCHGQSLNDTETAPRTVTLNRCEEYGLGLSIKGGAEHQFPVVVSRIVKDGPADKLQQLFVGDEILSVNDVEINENTTHDEALQLLRSNNEVILKVKHHRAVTVLRKTWKKTDDNRHNPIDIQMDNPLIRKTPKLAHKSQTQWKECVRMELFLAHLSRYLGDCDKLRDSGFELRSSNGQTAVVQCDNNQMCSEWCNTIVKSVENLNEKHMTHLNSLLPQAENVLFMGWVSEGRPTAKHEPRQGYKWTLRYLLVMGGSAYLFSSPPLSLIEKHDKLSANFLSSQSLKHYKCFQSLFRYVKSKELTDERKNCFIMQSCDDPTFRYLSTETAEELMKIKVAWNRSNYNSVTTLGSKTFSVTENGRSGSLTLDWRMGFAFYDTQTKEYKWKYRFHQLKHSSDDGRSKLSLTFVINPCDSRITETQQIECTSSLQNLLYCMHSFLSAKVASVDPRFMQTS